MYKQYLSAKSLIAKILEENPETRANDKLLMLEVWKKQEFVLSLEQERKFKSVMSPEVIRRTRQKIQQDGKYLPEDRVVAKRKGESNAMHDELMSEDRKAEDFSKTFLI